MPLFYDDLPYDKSDPKSIEDYAKRLLGHSFRWVAPVVGNDLVEESIEDTFADKKRKGGLGNFLEEQYFGYKANSDSLPDFPEAGVELKVTPYEVNSKGKLKAGERLVLTMISYDKPVEADLFKSHLWDKCKMMLLIYYHRDRALISNLDYIINFVKLFTPPPKDLELIIQDYIYIISKIAAGKANELSEADTMYLGACTKGATAEKSTVPQSYYAPDTLARKRAFCFKTSYMTYVLNNYIASDVDTFESISTDEELLHNSFEDIITSKIKRYVGLSDFELCRIFERQYNNNKAQWSDLAFRMLGIRSNKAEEFEKAQIVVKAVRVEEDDTIVESSPLPTFTFRKLVEEEWDDSELFNYFSETKFFFVVFKRRGAHYVLKGSRLWNMPLNELNTVVYDGWDRIRQTIIDGVRFTITTQKNGQIAIRNDFPKKSDNPIIHIRPHAQEAYYVLEDGKVYGNGKYSDSDELPDGRRMTKQSFWLNNTYIVSILKDLF